MREVVALRVPPITRSSDGANSAARLVVPVSTSVILATVLALPVVPFQRTKRKPGAASALSVSGIPGKSRWTPGSVGTPSTRIRPCCRPRTSRVTATAGDRLRRLWISSKNPSERASMNFFMSDKAEARPEALMPPRLDHRAAWRGTSDSTSWAMVSKRPWTRMGRKVASAWAARRWAMRCRNWVLVFSRDSSWSEESISDRTLSLSCEARNVWSMSGRNHCQRPLGVRGRQNSRLCAQLVF